MALLSFWLQIGLARLSPGNCNYQLNILGPTADFCNINANILYGGIISNSCSHTFPLSFNSMGLSSSLNGWKNISCLCDQLKSVFHLRINLSPFTKDFRVWEAPIENLNYLSSFLWGSNHISRFRHGSFAVRVANILASGNLSKSIFSPNYWHQLKSSTKTEMGNFAKKFWSKQHPVFPGGHPSKYWLGSMLLNCSDRTRTGVFNMIWPLARVWENVNTLFLQHTSTFDRHQHQLILWRSTFFVPVTSS